jgi:single-strand DNA-binding protein
MAGINKVIIIGALGQDPTTHNNVTKISIATSDSWKDKQTGEMQEKTEWHRVVFFNRLAEIAAQYLNKGSKVYIEGSLRTSKYTDKDGVERYNTEIVASKLEMLSSKQDSQSSSATKSSYSVNRSEKSNLGVFGNAEKSSKNDIDLNEFEDLPF